MEDIKTIKLQILSHNDNTFSKTLEIYRKALEFFIDVVNQNWHLLNDLTERQKLKKVEKLTHATKSNPTPPFEFDSKESKFYKFPSYFRRSCIKEALGVVGSHKSRHEQWLKKRDKYQAKGKEFNEKPPKLQYKHYSFPVFYKKNMFKNLDSNKAKIKVYRGNCNWEWVTITFDDSGEVERGVNKQGKETNYEVCVFQNGKEYNADLNASYNIGARYFIKYFLKPLSEKARLRLEAKVPSISKRTTCVLASLISLNESAKQLNIA